MRKYEIATFAGGCFWCMVEPFWRLNDTGELVKRNFELEKNKQSSDGALTLISFDKFTVMHHCDIILS